MLKEDFIPVAIDQWYQRRQKDAEGRFFQAIAKQGPRSDLNATTQGSYIVSAAGKLIGYNNNFGPERIRKMMKSSIARKSDWSAESLGEFEPDPNMEHHVPKGGIVVQVNSKVLGGYAKPRNEKHRLMQSAISRDNMWILPVEKELLLAMKFPESLALKLARFHLMDSTRGEPPMWEADDVKGLEIKLNNKGLIVGEFHLESADGQRMFRGEIRGHLESDENSITRLDMVARGIHTGHGQWNGGSPAGEFPVAVALRLAEEEDIAYPVRPQALKAFGKGYMDFGK